MGSQIANQNQQVAFTCSYCLAKFDAIEDQKKRFVNQSNMVKIDESYQ